VAKVLKFAESKSQGLSRLLKDFSVMELAQGAGAIEPE
jgi:hypothetical protein